jgi:L-threonylcarbamoyladenylate synthase
METRLVPIDPTSPDPAILNEAIEILRRGGLVAIPTETVYGLAAHALDPVAVGRIFQAKGRPNTNPVIVHVATMEQAKSLTTVWSESATQLANAFWPGPLTIILPRNSKIPDAVTAGGSTVALRIPSHAVARVLLRNGGMPLAAPSANRSQNLSPTRAEHVFKDLSGRIDLILDAGATPGGIESTVIDLSAQPRILRPGPISPKDIERVLGYSCELVQSPVAENEVMRSPGQMARHYAPRTPLVLSNDSAHEVTGLRNEGRRIGWLAFDDETETADNVTLMPRDPIVYASRMYDELHRMDEAGFDIIVVSMPPQGSDWLAIHDRLRRAATQ